jgi:hypothetical protein
MEDRLSGDPPRRKKKPNSGAKVLVRQGSGDLLLELFWQLDAPKGPG